MNKETTEQYNTRVRVEKLFNLHLEVEKAFKQGASKPLHPMVDFMIHQQLSSAQQTNENNCNP